jgi:dGTPase
MIKELRIRERTEGREESLSPFARQSARSQGRLLPEESDPLRTCFQRDRDRILHTKAFRRLKHKTQVFIAPLGDHFVTRLTHTLEVSQVARTIARALNLNEDLTEAVSLGHDLGHTPFGHIGEDTLDELFEGGFHHNQQSLRVVDVLEKDGQGLNLTWEVRDGILNHSKGEMDIFSAEQAAGATYEAEIVKIADAIAYINHDIGDAIRAGILSEDDLPAETVTVLGRSHSQRVNTMICDIVENSWGVSGAGSPGEVPVICMSPRVALATESLRRFMFQRVYKTLSRRSEAEHARSVVRKLYNYFTQHEDELPPEYRDCGEERRRVVDYIAGMTDQYALHLAAEHNL